MKFLKPIVKLVAATHLNDEGQVESMLEALEAGDWTTDADSYGEELIEIAGRLCYRSFNTYVNENVNKIREGNHLYISNILKQHHGSVLEHSSVTFALLNVSRILTHEIVRHRAGTAFSQESGRYVRLDEIGMYLPNLEQDFQELAKYSLEDRTGFSKAHGNTMWRVFQKYLEAAAELTEDTNKEFAPFLNDPAVPFDLKKKITSALRRGAPGGQTTNIIVTANHRAWRHMIEMRTSPGAEVEIRDVFLEIMEQLHKAFPAIYQDSKQLADGTIVFANSKV